MNNCKNCKFFDGKYCDEIGDEDETEEKYAHNNHPMIGIEVFIHDDSGLDMRVRVNENFGCVLFQEKKS